MSALGFTRIYQIAVACVVGPLLISALVYFLWPNIWKFFAEKVRRLWRCLTYPCARVYVRYSEDKSRLSRHSRTPEPHYLGANPTNEIRQSKSKAERKVRVENPKKREQRASEELSAAELKNMSRLKAKATRVEKMQKQPSQSSITRKKTNGFKYQFREESLSEEVNPYLSSNSSTTPFDVSSIEQVEQSSSDNQVVEGGDLESGLEEN